MRVVIISLNNSLYNGARKLQIAKVVKSLQDAGVYTTIITVTNRELDSVETKLGRVIYLPCKVNEPQTFLGNIYSRFKKKIENLFPFCKHCIRECISKALSIIDEEKPYCIITSSNPIDSHLVGLSIKRRTGLPWVASFSDPRPVSILPPPYNRNVKRLHAALEKFWIAKVLRYCDAVHMPSKYGLRLIEKSIGIHINDKSYAIPHIGFNPVDMKDCKYKGWIVHAGRLYSLRVSTSFLLAIRETHEQIPDHFKGLICVGSVCPEFMAKIRELNIDDIVKIIGHVPQEEVIKITGSASAIVVLEANMKISPFLPSKFADYACLGIPILAVTPLASAIRDYLDKFGGGIAVNHDKDEIVRGLIKIFSDYITGNTLPVNSPNKLAHEFSSKTVGNQYRKMLSEIHGNR